MCRVIYYIVGRGCLSWPVCSLRKTLLASAQLPFVLQGHACLLLQAPFDFLLLHSNPLWWKKSKRWRIGAFEQWCLRRLLRIPWTARRSNQPIIKEISPGCSLQGLMLKLKLQYFGHLMWRVDSLEKTLMLGGIGGRRRRGWQKMRWLDGIST